MRSVLKYRFLALTTLALLALSQLSCGHNRVYDFKPKTSAKLSIIFGFINILIDGKPATSGSIVTLESGQTLHLDRAGFIAANVTAGRSYIQRVNITGSPTDYTFPNLSIKSGVAGSRVYIGNITVNISSGTNTHQLGTDFERWTWSAENKWPQAYAVWKKLFGQGNAKYYIGIAEKTAPDSTPDKEPRKGRNIATDRQEVETGF